MPRMSNKRQLEWSFFLNHLKPYHIQRPLPGLYPRLQAEFPGRDYPLPPVLLQALETKGGHRLWQITANITTSN